MGDFVHFFLFFFTFAPAFWPNDDGGSRCNENVSRLMIRYLLIYQVGSDGVTSNDYDKIKLKIIILFMEYISSECWLYCQLTSHDAKMIWISIILLTTMHIICSRDLRHVVRGFFKLAICLGCLFRKNTSGRSRESVPREPSPLNHSNVDSGHPSRPGENDLSAARYLSAASSATSRSIWN